MAHEVPPLPYDYNALEPHIDEQTMRLHHDKHHGAYVTNLNAALDKHPDLKNKSVEELLRSINSVPEDIRTAVRNNGGGHANHTMFWNIMGPKKGGAPSGKIPEQVLRVVSDDAADTAFDGELPFALLIERPGVHLETGVASLLHKVFPHRQMKRVPRRSAEFARCSNQIKRHGIG